MSEAAAAYLAGIVHNAVKNAEKFVNVTAPDQVVFGPEGGSVDVRFEDGTVLRLHAEVVAAEFFTCRYCGDLIYDDSTEGEVSHWLSRKTDINYCYEHQSPHRPERIEG